VKLITECNFNIKSKLVESKEGGKSLFIEGIFMQCETPNRNGRIYPEKVLASEVARYKKEFVDTNRALGELNHPESPVVDPQKASHLITRLEQNGKNFVGRAKILDTPVGQTVKGLLAGGVQLGVSSRGMGSIQERKDGINEVQDDFKLSTVDIVHDPSAPDAFVNGIMEGVDWVWQNGKLTARQIESYRTDIARTSKKNRDAAKLEAFKDFLKKLKV
jgi:hypothetical protein